MNMHNIAAINGINITQSLRRLTFIFSVFWVISADDIYAISKEAQFSSSNISIIVTSM